MTHAVKTEPAGSGRRRRIPAGPVGHRQASSFLEIAWALRLVGFTRALFLAFNGFSPDAEGANHYLQEAFEEGEYMGALAENLLTVLDWELPRLLSLVHLERAHSRLNYRLRPLDDDRFEALNPVVHINLTGDNTRQPGRAVVSAILDGCLPDRDLIAQELAWDGQFRKLERKIDILTFIKVVFGSISDVFVFLQRMTERLKKRTVQFTVGRLARWVMSRM